MGKGARHSLGVDATSCGEKRFSLVQKDSNLSYSCCSSLMYKQIPTRKLFYSVLEKYRKGIVASACLGGRELAHFDVCTKSSSAANANGTRGSRIMCGEWRCPVECCMWSARWSVEVLGGVENVRSAREREVNGVGEGRVLGRGSSAREREGAEEGVLGRGKGEMNVES